MTVTANAAPRKAYALTEKLCSFWNPAKSDAGADAICPSTGLWTDHHGIASEAAIHFIHRATQCFGAQTAGKLVIRVEPREQ